MGAYLINFFKKEELISALPYQRNGALSPSKFVQEAPIDDVVALTQDLIKKYFLVVGAANKTNLWIPQLVDIYFRIDGLSIEINKNKELLQMAKLLKCLL